MAAGLTAASSSGSLVRARPEDSPRALVSLSPSEGQNSPLSADLTGLTWPSCVSLSLTRLTAAALGELTKAHEFNTNHAARGG